MSKKVVISGYYGDDNFGDEAILESLIQKLKKEGANITVLSSNPKKTSALHSVKSIKKFNLLKVILEIAKCDTLISGGGSLLQDATSLKSLLYYLWVISVAQFYKKDVVIFAHGIGPINSKIGQSMTKKRLERADIVTVRDDKSLFLLRGWGIKTTLVCDPLFDLEIPGSNPKNKVGIQLRAFKTLTEKLMLALANRVATEFSDKEIEIYSLQDSKDLEVCKHFESLLLAINPDLKIKIIHGETPKDIIKRFAELEYMIAMRFHAVLIALKYGVKTLAINYDKKVETIASEAGIPALSMLANEDYGYMFNRLKSEDRRQLIEYTNEKHFNWELFEPFIK